LASFHEYMNEFKKQLDKGVIQKAYGGLMEYIMDLRTLLQRRYPDYFVSAIYHGYMDMTYFSFTSKTLQERRLKTAIVFVYDKFRFEVWLTGYNKSVQDEYWKLFRESGWDKYQVVPTTKGADSIVEHVIVEDPDFSDLDALTKRIEKEAMKFILDVEGFLYKHTDPRL
jgi:hypothetical protein